MYKNRCSIITLIFCFNAALLFAQKKDCLVEYEEKTDSTFIKKTKNVLVHERVFGNSKEILFFSLVNSDGVPMLGIQYIQKSTEFISSHCFDSNSKIIFQLENGKFVTLLHSGKDNCSLLNYDAESKSNIRIMTSYFYFMKDNFEELKSSPLSLMRINFVGERKDIVFKNKIESELMRETYIPTNYFIDFLNCIN